MKIWIYVQSVWIKYLWHNLCNIMYKQHDIHKFTFIHIHKIAFSLKKSIWRPENQCVFNYFSLSFSICDRLFLNSVISALLGIVLVVVMASYVFIEFFLDPSKLRSDKHFQQGKRYFLCVCLNVLKLVLLHTTTYNTVHVIFLSVFQGSHPL